jgi:Na+/glutamate symporter
MSQQGDRFAGGFIAGTLFGGIVGGLVGSWLANRVQQQQDEATESALQGNAAEMAKEQLKKMKRRILSTSDEVSMEEARQGLEEKIAQLNTAIDQARQQMSKANGASQDFE